MNIKSISSVSQGKINHVQFEGKKEKNESSSSQIRSGVRTAVPTAALILAMLSDPVTVSKAEAAPLDEIRTEIQHRPGGGYRAPQPNRQPSRPPQPNRQPSRPAPRPTPQPQRPAPTPHRPAPQPHRPAPAPHRPVPPPHYHHAPIVPHHHHHPYRFIRPELMMLNYIYSVAELNAYYNAPVSVGGVAFNQNDILDVNTFEDNGTVYNSVTMTNGTNISYPSQYSGRYALVRRGDGGYIFEGLSDAFIIGSSNSDRYTLKGCAYTTVDVGSDSRKDNVKVTTYRLLPGGIRQYTEEVNVIANAGDVVNGSRVYDHRTMTYNGF